MLNGLSKEPKQERIEKNNKNIDQKTFNKLKNWLKNNIDINTKSKKGGFWK